MNNHFIVNNEMLKLYYSLHDTTATATTTLNMNRKPEKDVSAFREACPNNTLRRIKGTSGGWLLNIGSIRQSSSSFEP